MEPDIYALSKAGFSEERIEENYIHLPSQRLPKYSISFHRKRPIALNG
jgi:hypothetical protein